MFLSSGLLSDDERRLAFDAVPELDALRLSNALARALVSPDALLRLDALGGGFSREAFAAHADALFLVMRAAGQVAESKAAELFCSRDQPTGWLKSTGKPEPEEDQRLRTSLALIPLEAGAMYIDAAMNHYANAVLRFALESGFDAAEVQKLGLDVTKTATENGWTSWRPMARTMTKLEQSGALVAKFVLSKALLACYRDPDMAAVITYRDMLVHRGVPADLRTQAVKRRTGLVAGAITIKWPLSESPASPDVPTLRDTMARALVVCREGADAVHRFLPIWAEHVGFKIMISKEGVGINFSVQQSKVAMPPSVIHLPGKPARITVPVHGMMAIRARAHRDPTLFTS